MIDCHAHAFPTIGEQIGRVSPEAAHALHDVKERIKQRVPPLLRGAAKGVLSKAIFDIEQVASMRRSSEAAHKYESAMTFLALPQVLAGGSARDLLASMEKNGITRTVLIAAEPTAPNAWVLEQARASEGRLVPVVNVPAMRDDATEAQWLDALDTLAREGAAGFKIHLNMDGLGHDHRGYRHAFEVADEHGLFVIVHTGCFHTPIYKRTEPAEPSLFVPLFERFPRVRVCLAHMNRDEPEKAWDVMKRFDQVWTDTSWQPRAAVKRARDVVGLDRLLLGSDWPLLHPGLQGDAARVVRDALGDADAERVGDANARVFLDG